MPSIFRPRLLMPGLAVALALAAGNARAADGSFFVQVPGADKLWIAPPAGWTQNVDKAALGIPATIDFNLPGGAALKVTFMPDPKGQFAKADELEKLVIRAIQQFMGNSVDKKMTMERLNSSSGPGVYASQADPKLVNVAKPPAGEFRHVTSGAISLGRQVVIFSLLSNSRDNEEYRQALDFLVKGISVAAASP